jgi:hypothetical protein
VVEFSLAWHLGAKTNSESAMRYLLCAVLTLAACERRDTGRDVQVTDTAAPDAGRSNQAMGAVPDRLIGTWTARGLDEGSTKAQEFTLTWSRSADGALVGTIAFRPGTTYNVKVVSTGDSTIVYQSEPHRSPSLNAQVVTRTEARLVGDSLVGTYEAKAQTGGKTLRGRFTAVRR